MAIAKEYKQRKLKTKVGTLKLFVPQEREGRFKTQLFAKVQKRQESPLLSLMQDVHPRGFDHYWDRKGQGYREILGVEIAKHRNKKVPGKGILIVLTDTLP